MLDFWNWQKRRKEQREAVQLQHEATERRLQQVEMEIVALRANLRELAQLKDPHQAKVLERILAPWTAQESSPTSSASLDATQGHPANSESRS